MARLRLPAPVRAAGATLLRDVREGWTLFRTMTWVWVGSATLAVLNLLQAGVWGVLGPLLAEDSFGAAAWGLVLSASAVGFLVSSVVMYRVTFTHLLGIGHLCLALQAVPLVLLGTGVPVPVLVAGAFVSGAAPASTASPTRRRSTSTSPATSCRGWPPSMPSPRWCRCRSASSP
jgi:hypothetical protein